MEPDFPPDSMPANQSLPGPPGLKSWWVNLAGEVYLVEVKGYGGVKWPEIWVDGKFVPGQSLSRRGLYPLTRQVSFRIATAELVLQIVPSWVGYHYNLAVNGRSVTDSKPVRLLQPLPRWVWVFVVLFFALPLVVRDWQGGAVLACAGALICLLLVQRESGGPRRQLATCIVMLFGTAILGGLLDGGLRPDMDFTTASGILNVVQVPEKERQSALQEPAPTTDTLNGQTGSRPERAGTPEAWAVFAPPGGDFQVEMPGIPRQETLTQDQVGMHLDLIGYALLSSRVTYLAYYTDYPQNIKLPDAEQMLAAWRDSVASKGDVLTVLHLTLGGMPGLELVVRNPQGANFEHLRSFAVGRRMYVISAITAQEEAAADEVARFLNSFSVTGSAGREAAEQATTTVLAVRAAAATGTVAAATAAVETATAVAFDKMLPPTPDCFPAWRLDFALQTSTRSELQALAVRSADDVWIGGWALDQSGDGHTRLAHWDGREWRTTPWPGLYETVDTIEALVAPGPNAAWAFATLQEAGPLVVTHWDGQQWQDVPLPRTQPGNQDEGVAGREPGRQVVSAAAASGPDDVWAVGTSDLPTGTAALLLHWDGGHLQQVGFPNTLRAVQLSGVVAVSPSDAWAIGSYAGDNQALQCLLLHWDGTHWQQMPCPASPESTPEGATLGFAAITSHGHDVWAIETVSSSTGLLYKAYLLRWTGNAWQPVMIPLSTNVQALHAISATGPSDIWLAGTMQSESGQPVGLLMRWDGQNWQQQHPDGTWITEAADFVAIQASGANDVWALSPRQGDNTNVWHYSIPCQAASNP